MPEMISYRPGTFCWIDLGTTDAAGAKKFYTELFGWDVVDNPVSDGMIYTNLQLKGKDVAALYELPEASQNKGVPPYWAHYVSVESADESASKVVELGGTLLMEPFDVLDVGRMALLQDPGGAVLAVWQPKSHKGAAIVNEPGSFCWNELATRDTDQAKEFYGGLFGWESQTQDVLGGQYTTFMNGDQHSGGMLQMTDDWGDMSPHWMVYFAVEDCEDAVEKITELGGAVHYGPNDIPKVGKFAIVSDPQGAPFTVIKLIVAS